MDLTVWRLCRGFSSVKTLTAVNAVRPAQWDDLIVFGSPCFLRSPCLSFAEERGHALSPVDIQNRKPRGRLASMLTMLFRGNITVATSDYRRLSYGDKDRFDCPVRVPKLEVCGGSRSPPSRLISGPGASRSRQIDVNRRNHLLIYSKSEGSTPGGRLEGLLCSLGCVTLDGI